MGDRPLILVDPLPRTLNLICGPEVRRRPEALGRLVVSEGKAMPDEIAGSARRLTGGRPRGISWASAATVASGSRRSTARRLRSIPVSIT